MKLCVICRENKTARLMDGGWGKKLPVCTDCLTSGRYIGFVPAAKPSTPEAPAKVEPGSGAIEGVGNYFCPKCQITHKAGSKPHKRHLKLLK